MKKTKLPLQYICICFLMQLASSQLKSQTLDSTNLPIVVLDTYGQTITDTTRDTIFMGIIDNGFGNTNHITDPYTNYNGDVTIEIRGSTSQQYPKKAYAFTPVDSNGVKINYPMMGMPTENDWILYAPYPDKTMMRNTLTYYLANKMGHYASRTKLVELVRNGSYRGVYELQEKVKRDHNRVNVTKLLPIDTLGDALTGGYIIKIDKTTGSGVDTFLSNYDPGVFFQYHYPDDAVMHPKQKAYIQSYVDSFETALNAPYFTDLDSGYRKYISTNSFIDFFLLQELGHTVDGYRSSCFLHKDRWSKGGKLKMGPMWDFNLSYGNANYCDAYDTTGWQYQFNMVCTGYSPHVPNWWDRLLQDTLYQNEVQCRWHELRTTFLSTVSINSWIDSVANYLSIDSAQQRNYIKWPIIGVFVNWNYFIGNSYQEEIDYLKTFIEARSIWMDNNLPGNLYCPVDHTGIAQNKNSNSVFSLIPNPTSGNFNVQFNSTVARGNISVYNILGELILQQEIQNEKKKEIFLTNHNSGIYFVKVFDGDNYECKKLVVE